VVVILVDRVLKGWEALIVNPLKQHALSVVKNARFHSSQQAESRYFVESVSEKMTVQKRVVVQITRANLDI